MALYRMEVTGITCAHCVDAIRQVLADQGASPIAVDGNDVTVDIAPDRLDAVRVALADAGYEVAMTRPITTVA